MVSRTNDEGEEDYGDESDLFGDDAFSDGADDGERNGNDDGEQLDPKIVALLEEREKAMWNAVADGDTKHPVYPAWQRAMSKKDKAITERDALLAQLYGELESLRESSEGAKAGFGWLQTELLDALPEGDRPRAELELKKVQLTHQENEAKRRAERAAARPAERPQYDDLTAHFNEQRDKFIASRKEVAKRAGVNPDDSELDFGDDNDPVAERLYKFEASLQKVIDRSDDKRIDSVRQRGVGVSTRAGGGGKSGGARSAPTGVSNLQVGAEERIREILNQMKGR